MNPTSNEMLTKSDTNTSKELFKEFTFAKQSWILFLSAILLALIFEFGVKAYSTGLSYLLFFFLFISVYQIFKPRKQPKDKWIVLSIVFFSFNMFYYNNYLASHVLPFVIGYLMLTLISNVKVEVSSLYKSFIPKISLLTNIFNYFEQYMRALVQIDVEKSVYKRTFIGIGITIPFVVVFMLLLSSADANYSNFLKNSLNILPSISLGGFFRIPIFTLVFLGIFLSSFSYIDLPKVSSETKDIDPIILGIFLGAINFLFISFVLFQISYLFDGLSYVQASNLAYAKYARSGFFQLSAVMSLSSIILLYTYHKAKRKSSARHLYLLQIMLALEVIIIGISSIMRMHLYQDVYGFTVLRYYVEWFSYFLLLLLGAYIVYFSIQKSFQNFMNLILSIGIISLLGVSSINIDALVVKSNVQKAINSDYKLDKVYLNTLSIDAIEPLIDNKIASINWKQRQRIYKECGNAFDFHLGYCLKSKLLNDKN